MNIVITGGGGFLGSRLTRKLVSKDKHNHITLFDAAFGAEVPGARAVKGDIADPASLGEVVKGEIDTVFHLAAVVSGAAEADFDLGMRVNLEGTKNLLERCRKLPRPPKVVFSSSVAAFGGDLPPELDDSTTPTPQTSYGAQKVMGEYLIADYSRKGYIDGRSLRLPTIVVRAGKPNAAASSFASGILREPLNGVVSECPVVVRCWRASCAGRADRRAPQAGRLNGGCDPQRDSCAHRAVAQKARVGIFLRRRWRG